MLDDTLVVWMGEFGRTPQDQRRGRPRSLPQGVQRRCWPAAAFAADRSSARPTRAAPNVTDRPVTVNDLFRIDLLRHRHRPRLTKT